MDCVHADDSWHCKLGTKEVLEIYLEINSSSCVPIRIFLQGYVNLIKCPEGFQMTKNS